MKEQMRKHKAKKRPKKRKEEKEQRLEGGLCRKGGRPDVYKLHKDKST